MGTSPPRSLVLNPVYTDLSPLSLPCPRYTTLGDPKDPGYTTTLTFRTFASTGTGNVHWTNPDYAREDDGAYATASVGAIVPYTYLLRCTNATNLDQIPEDAILEQIRVVVQGKCSVDNGGGWWVNAGSSTGIWLYNGVRIGDNSQADIDDTSFGTTDTDCTCPGSGDLWESGLTEGREIKNSSFGVEFKLTTLGGSVDLSVDYVYMMIDWNNPLTPPQGSPKRYRSRPPLRRRPNRLGGFM